MFVADYFRDPQERGLCNKIPERFQRSSVFLFSSLRFASERRAVNKNPSFASLRGILLRSVADSNRRTRFCRPMPSHSANRPFFSVDAYPPAGGQPTIFFCRCLSASWRTTDHFLLPMPSASWRTTDQCGCKNNNYLRIIIFYRATVQYRPYRLSHLPGHYRSERLSWYLSATMSPAPATFLISVRYQQNIFRQTHSPA